MDDDELLDVILKHRDAQKILGDALSAERWAEIADSDCPSQILSSDERQNVETEYDYKQRKEGRIVTEFYDAVSPEYDHQPSTTSLYECLGAYWISGVEGTGTGPFFSESEGVTALDSWKSDLSFYDLEDAEKAMREM